MTARVEVLTAAILPSPYRTAVADMITPSVSRCYRLGAVGNQINPV